MTKNYDSEIVLEGILAEDIVEDTPEEDITSDIKQKWEEAPITRKAGPGYGRPISTEVCSFCLGKGVVEKRRGKVMCLACEGLGTKGGAGKGRHPITLDMVRPYRTHMEEKPLED